MRRSNRAIIAALVGVAILFASWALFADLNSVSESYERDAAYATQHYARAAEDKVRDGCGTRPAQNQGDCVSEVEQAANQHQHDAQDLAAQKITAWWTKVMAVAALVGVALSIVGVLLVWTTFRETRDANRIATEAAKPRVHFSLAAAPDIMMNATVNIVASNVGGSGCVVTVVSHAWCKRTEVPENLEAKFVTIPLAVGQSDVIDTASTPAAALRVRRALRGHAYIEGPLLDERNRLLEFAFLLISGPSFADNDWYQRISYHPVANSDA